MFTVEWIAAAYDDFKEICLHASTQEERDSILRAAYQIDELLQFSPSMQGEVIFAGQLSPEALDDLGTRMNFIPEVSGRLRIGPIEFYFTAYEDEGRTVVWSLRRRT